MTESSIFDPGYKPGMKNKPTANRGALAFNPLHPSMELPPEQLIRLLGMESKKTRKHLIIQHSSKQQNPRRAIDEKKTQPSPDHQNALCATGEEKQQASQESQQSHPIADEQKPHRSPNQGARKKTADRPQRPKPQPLARPSHPMEYERNEPADFDKRSPGWLLPALVTGLVAGITVSASLFWYQSSSSAKQEAPVPVASSEPRNRQIPKRQPNSQLEKRKAAPDSAKTTALPTPAKAAGSGNDANWQAALKAEQNRLRSAAKQRLTEQLTKMKVNRELAELQEPPVDEHTPVAAATLPAAAELAFDQLTVNEPATASAESPPGEESPFDMMQADKTKPAAEAETLPAVIPTQAVESDRNDEMFEESTGFVDRFEQQAVSDVTAATEQDTASNIAPSLDVNTTTAFTPSIEGDSVSDVAPSNGDEMKAGQISEGISDESPSSASEDSASF